MTSMRSGEVFSILQIQDLLDWYEFRDGKKTMLGMLLTIESTWTNSLELRSFATLKLSPNVPREKMNAHHVPGNNYGGLTLPKVGAQMRTFLLQHVLCCGRPKAGRRNKSYSHFIAELVHRPKKASWEQSNRFGGSWRKSLMHFVC